MRNRSLLFSLLFGATGLLAQDVTPPVVSTLIPAAGAPVVQLRKIEVFFNEGVQGVTADDLLINGTAATNVVEVVPGLQYSFTFPQPASIGTVQVAWSVGNGITDLATPANNFAGGSWTYTLNPALALYSVRINEFLASNSGSQTNSIRDEDGAESDWIELYNGSPITVNLDGCYLTDTKGELRRWRLPNYSLTPNSYLIVWASNKDRTNVFGPLHTNFRLSTSSGYLGLIDPSGTNAISSFDPYPTQRTDVSYGRDPLDPSALGFYTRTTPGAQNSTAGSAADFAPDVIFSHESSTFVNDFSLVLSTPSPSAVIRYVLVTNGATASASLTNVPTASSPAYTGPILINQTTQVRVRAFEPGKLAGTPVSQTYFQLSPNVVGFSSDLPIVIVNNFAASATLPSTDQTMALASFDSGFERSSMTNKPVLVTRGAANDRGSSTAGQVKQNMAVEFWDEFNQDADRPLLGMPAESDWVFYGINAFDQGLMHNAIFHWFGDQLGHYSSRTRYVEVFRKTTLGPISTNDYFGLFLLREKPKRNDNRVNIRALRPENTNGLSVTGGYLLRIDRTDADEHFFRPPSINSLASTPADIVIDYPPRNGTPSVLIQSNYIRTYLLNFLTNLSVTNISQETGYPAYIKTDSWIDNLVANIICYNVDGYRLSGYFFKDRGEKLEQGPLWDCDRCLGTGGAPNNDPRPFNPRQWRNPTTSQTADNGTDFFGRSSVGVSWFGKLFSDPDFWQAWIDRYQTLRTNEYSTTKVFAMIDGFHDQIREAQVRENGRWAATFSFPRNGIVSANGYSYDFGPANPAFARGGYFTNEVNFQKQWFIDRFDFMDTNFLAMPVLSTGSAMVTNGTVINVQPAAKAGTLLLYTLDGTDPRLPGGGISPLARTNAGSLSLVISNNVRLYARSYNISHANVTNAGSSLYGNPILNSFWSAPVAATYYVSVPPLRITEIMYHPANPPPGIATNDDNFEYVEFKNIGATPLNVNRFRLRGGVDFDFSSQILAAGEAAVIVRNVAAFQSRYGGGPRILGVYTNDSLGNDGDQLVLEGGVREPILNFRYDDKWYPITDGQGFSLQIINENAGTATWGDQASWRPSGVLQGTPGTNDPGPINVPVVYINEALTHTDPSPGDVIELYNPGGSPVSLTDWYLTDDFNAPKKYRIPAGNSVPANGYLVFSQSNSFGLGLNGFALSSKGDEIYLFSGDAAGNLTGWAHGFDFGPQANGATFGRHVISTGEDHFVSQIAPTLGAANSGPKVGPIIISEINYHPPDLIYPRGKLDNELHEYVELQNITSSPVPLYDPLNPANTWRLRDAVSYTFPATNVVMPANGFVLVVGFHPTNTTQLNSFIAANAVPPGTVIFGPWDGKLDNSGDSIELVQPDLPDPPGSPSAGFVPYILADKVNYLDTAPWPVGLPDGLGAVLGRVNVSAYGNDPANWRTAPKTPGLPLPPGGTAPTIVIQPVSAISIQGQSASFSISATGPALGYQWVFNGDPVIDKPSSISGGSGPVLNLSNLPLNQAGLYVCFVYNSAGSVSSTNVTLTVRPLPRITSHPADVTLRGSTNAVDYGSTTNKTASFGVTVTGTGLVRYQWRFNGINILGANASTFNVTGVELVNDGVYDVVVTDDVSSLTSNPARLTVLVSPILSVGPAPVINVLTGATFSVSVTATGNPLPFGFAWFQGSTPRGSNVVNARTDYVTFTAPGTVVANQTWRVVIRNAANLNPTAFATLLVNTYIDSDGDGLPDAWETQNGLNPASGADRNLDSDGDGMTNYAEYIAGTDPNNNLSYLRISAISASGTASVTFGAASNKTYTVQYTDDLNVVTWQKLGNVSSRTINRDETLADPQFTTNRFYRVVTPALP